MPATIIGKESLLRPTDAEGKENLFFKLANYADLRGVKPTVKGDIAYISGITDYSAFNLKVVLAVVAAGAEVQGYPVWIEATAEAMKEQVPDYVDADQPTWEDWKDDFHHPTQFEGNANFYIPSDSKGPHLPGSILARLNSDGYKMHTIPQMKNMALPEEEQKEEEGGLDVVLNINL